jgi:hypothetical protein
MKWPPLGSKLLGASQTVLGGISAFWVEIIYLIEDYFRTIFDAVPNIF